jgi:predicted nucleotidyltransferase
MYVAEMIPAISDSLEKQKNKIPRGRQQIIVFGSDARGTATLRSDIDLALIYENEADELREDRAVMHHLLHDVTPLTEVTFFGTTFNKLAEATKPTTANYGIKKEGVVIWEAPVTKI